jgi:hypothetical protein
VLDPALRKQLVQALILLRNRGQLPATQLLPLFFKLFKVQDKALREMLFRWGLLEVEVVRLARHAMLFGRGAAAGGAAAGAAWAGSTPRSAGV